MAAETMQQSAKRRRQRVLFDSVADLYDSTRPGYPPEVVESMLATAGIEEGDSVLEVGCGTGQLTELLARERLALTAIDIGPSMIALARRRLGGSAGTLQVVAFEDFAADGRSFDLVVSATAFHWIDPEVAWEKAARLLQPGGWLALLGTRERYDDPFGAALRDLWIELSDDGGAWTRKPAPTSAEAIATSGLFGTAVVRSHSDWLVLAGDAVVALEHTRATALSYDDASRRRFTDELRRLLDASGEVGAEQVTTLTMAQVRRRRPGADE